MNLHRRLRSSCFVLLSLLLTSLPCAAQTMVELRGTIVDANTNQPLAARVYLKSDDGKWYFARSADPQGSAVEYRKERGKQSVEMHTTLSAHPFAATVPAGKYTLTVERGKEYLPDELLIDLTAGPKSVTVRLKRWIDMAAQGWYSGETHVHRALGDLPTAMLADDLNVALPLTYWVTTANTPPSRGDRNAEAVGPQLIEVDRTHVIYAMNTEYEIFTVNGKPHTLGAVFALNHKNVLTLGVPPVEPVAVRIHAEGGMLELDKHNWPWSMMLVPVMKVDLYELTNNHIWRTNFAFGKFGEKPPDYMPVEQNAEGFTERGWIDFTFQNYYLLLNCGFRMRPTAGTASGVHPVPLGWGRVYVHLPDGFSYDAWIKGLNVGRSFVTTGPMLVANFDGESPGQGRTVVAGQKAKCRVQGWVRSAYRQRAIEIVAAGHVVRRVSPSNQQLPNGAFESKFDESLESEGSTWLAVRCFEEGPGGRPRFAHSAPYFIDDADHPLHPRSEEIRYLIDRVQAEFVRHTGILSDRALNEYREALRVYEEIALQAK